MISFLRSAAILLWLLCIGTPASALEVISFSRLDGKPVSVAVYRPETQDCRGVAIVSHGAGGSERGYKYLASAMAKEGYLTLVPGHAESGLRALQTHMRGPSLRDGLANLVTDPVAYQGRFMDIAAARAWAQSLCVAKFSVLIGHSMGAATVMMQAGAVSPLSPELMPPFTAYVALSPQGVGLVFPANAWRNISAPVLSITGTQDQELGGASWEVRTQGFENMPTGCKWLGVIDGATHMNFAGVGLSQNTERLSLQLIRDFLRGLLSGDCTQQANLVGLNLTVK
jgi:predicted dienelactone hydrolase